MSLSRAELEAMDREELVDTIVDLSDTVENIRATVNVNLDKRKQLEERVADLEAENERLRERLADTETTAEQAMTIASKGHDPSNRSQTEKARAVTRNTLVVRAANGGSIDRPVTVSKVQAKLEAEEPDLKWATVKHAWDSLRDDWPQFYETTKDGNKALSVKAGDITQSLARRVEYDLERDGLAKQFDGGTGGSPP